MNLETNRIPKKYSRIPIEKQKSLIELVFKSQWQIKKAACALEIIYASAKNVIARYRKTKILRKPPKKMKKKRCNYKKLENQSSPIKVISTSGGF